MPRQTVHPLVDHGVFDYKRINVEAQRRDPESLLNWTGRMIRLRHECPEIGWGTWRILPTAVPQTLAMCYDWRGNCVLVVIHNFDEATQEVHVKPRPRVARRLLNLHDNQHSVAMERHAPYRARSLWLSLVRVGSLNYALLRTE